MTTPVGTSGSELLAGGKFAKAALAFEAALSTCPGSADLWHDLGLARLKLHDHEGARTAFERGLTLEPGHMHARLNLARTELGAGNIERARGLCQALPGNATALVILGQAHEISGHAEEAEVAFRAALASDPDLVAPWSGLARLGLVGEPESLARRLERGGLQRPDEASLRMALAQTYDRAGEYDRAFAEAARGNLLRQTSFDPEVYGRLVDEMLAAPLPTSDSGSTATPIFIVGAPRSGSSLLERVLSRHPRCAGLGEGAAVERLLGSLGPPGNYGELDDAELSALAETYLREVGPLERGITHPIDKTPSNILFVGLLARVFPRAIFLYTRRDPRDVAISNYLTDFGDHRVGQATSLAWLGSYLGDVERMAQGWAARGDIHFLPVDYELLVEDLEGQVRRLLGALGLPWEPACLAFHEGPGACHTASSQQVRQPLNRRGLGRARPYARYLASLAQAMS